MPRGWIPGGWACRCRGSSTFNCRPKVLIKATALPELINTRPEITSAWTITGDTDYLLRVYCRDLAALNALLHEVLLTHPAVARVQSQVVMDEVKRDGPLPTCP